MITEIVVYTSTNGYLEFRKVPNTLHYTEYRQGIFVGPPDLQPLALSEGDTLALNNALVNAGYVNYKSLAGRRRDLLNLVQITLGISTKKATEVRLKLIGLYQKDYYLINEVSNND